MKLKSYLFSVSFTVFFTALAGCASDNDETTKRFQFQLDSAASANRLIVDSLVQVIGDYKKQIDSLEARNNDLRDSLKSLPAGISGKGPKVILYPQPSGIPTDVPLKK